MKVSVLARARENPLVNQSYFTLQVCLNNKFNYVVFLFFVALFVYSGLCVVSLSFDVCRNALSSSVWFVFGVPLIDSISCLLEWKRALSWHIFPGCKTLQYSGHPVGKEIVDCAVEMKW